MDGTSPKPKPKQKQEAAFGGKSGALLAVFHGMTFK